MALVDELDDFIRSPEEFFLGIAYFEKYKNLYLYVTKDQLMSILRNPRLKLSRTTKTNDCTENLAKSETQASYEVSNHGYICLSGTIHSSMMWGQYAGRSTGACLVFSGVFSEKKDKTSQKIWLDATIKRKNARDLYRSDDKRILIHKVLYTEEKVPSDAPIEQKLTTKAKGWEQEREYRVIIPLIEAVSEEEESTTLSYAYYDSSLMRALSRIVLAPLCDLSIVDVEKKINEIMQIGLRGTAPIRVTKATINTERNLIDPNLDKITPIPGWKEK